MKGDCIVCGKEVERSPSLFSKTGKVFCSHECSQAHHFKIRSKITNCIICKVELKPGEGWATPLKKRKDYLCPVCKRLKSIAGNRRHLNEIVKKLNKWHKKTFSEKNCKQCGQELPANKIGGAPFCKNSCRALFEYHKKKIDPKFVLSGRMRNLMNKSLRGGKRGISWQTLIGYSVDELKSHIEKLFAPGMCWENIGEWHIDHILPVSRFHYTTPLDPDFKKCWALSNLRPMWAKENISKSDKIEKPMQPSLSWFDTTEKPKIGRPSTKEKTK